jgi:carbonic anhydrase/acetyltransferase-like protein (isoleucine patch superfamily)
VLIGMGAIILDDAVIGDDCIVAAGALVTKGTQVPSGCLILGSPARVTRPLKSEELAFLKRSAENYVADAAEYYSYVHGPKKLGKSDKDLEDDDLEMEQEGDGSGEF